ncbi:MAG: C45 family peptidase [Planctomycetota bacterium]
MKSLQRAPGWSVVLAEGSPSERYGAQGRSGRGELGAALDALLQLPFVPERLPRGLGRLVLRGISSVLGRCYRHWHRDALDPFWREALDGLAAGLGLSKSQVYGLNAIELESSHFGFTPGCSSLGFAGSQTESGRPKLAYNHDFPPAFRPFAMIRRSDPTHGLRSLALTYPVLLGAVAGVNEAGLAVSLNHAFAADIRRRKPGRFLTMLLQECLERARSTQEAVDTVLRTETLSGGILTFVDASGDRAAIEISATRKSVRRPERNEVLWSVNQYFSKEMPAVEVPVGSLSRGVISGVDIHACNVSRSARLPRLLTRDKYGDRDIVNISSDHDGSSGNSLTVCRHDDPLSETLFNAILDPTTRTIDVCRGNPCRNRRETFHLTGEPSAVRSGARPSRSQGSTQRHGASSQSG